MILLLRLCPAIEVAAEKYTKAASADSTSCALTALKYQSAEADMVLLSAATSVAGHKRRELSVPCRFI